MSKKLLPVVILSAVALFAGYEYYRAQSLIPPDGLFQGYIEGEFVLVGPEQGGRIKELDLTEGDDVAKGAVLFTVDERAARERLNETRAAEARATAELENLTSAQQRPEQIRILQAALGRAKADLDLAVTNLQRQADLYRRKVTSKEHFDTARSNFLKARAARDESQRQISYARMPARQNLINAARSAVEAAKAARAQAEIALTKLTVHAPVNGKVQQILFRAGEIVAAGQPVVQLLPPARLKALFFVPEPQRASLQKGMEVRIACDSCPQDLSATVSFLSRDAEFTPPVIFSAEERSKLVFRIEARLSEAGRFLSPGQPVTVHLAGPQS